MKYQGGYIKLYDNEDTISKFYDYRGKPEDKGIPKEFHGKFIPGKVNEIRLQRRDVDINFEPLPKDVLHIINIDYDDDNDPDKGGQGILGKKNKSNMKKEEEEKGEKYLFQIQANPRMMIMMMMKKERTMQ